MSRGIHVANHCSFCHLEPKTINHVNFECTYTFNLLKANVPYTVIFLLRLNLLHVLFLIKKNPNACKASEHISLLNMCCTTYIIWREMSNRRFGSSYTSFFYPSIFHHGICQIQIIKKEKAFVSFNISLQFP